MIYEQMQILGMEGGQTQLQGCLLSSDNLETLKPAFRQITKKARITEERIFLTYLISQKE